MIKKYRSVCIFATFLLFNLLESLYFGQGTAKGFNYEPVSVYEWICDIVSDIGMYFAIMMGTCDVAKVFRDTTVTQRKDDMNEKY